MMRYTQRLKNFHEEDINREVEESKLETMSNYTTLTIVHGQDCRQLHREGYNELREELPSEKESTLCEPSEMFEAKASLGDKRNPRTVLLRGRGGMGKSTFVRKCVLDWAKDIVWKETFLAMYRFQMNELNLVTTDISCKELLQKYHGPGLSNEAENGPWNYMQNHQEKILIVLDGIDEFDLFDEGSSFPKVYDCEKKAPITHIIQNLHRGCLLPGARMLFTSRPVAQGLKILKEFDRVLEVQGFAEEQRQEFIKCSTDDNKEVAEEILGALRNDINLASFCLIPIICTVFCTVLKHTRKVAPTKDTLWHHYPTTATQLFGLLMAVYTSEHHKDHKNTHVESFWDVLQNVNTSLKKLAHLAYQGLRKEPMQIVFCTEDFKDMSICLEETKFGFLTSRQIKSHPYMSSKTHLYSFSHLLIQEYLAATYLAALPWNEVKEMLCVGHKHQEMMILYLGALWGDAKLHELLFSLHPEMKGKSNELKQNCRELLNFILVQDVNAKRACRREELLALMMLYETQEPEMVHPVAANMLKDGAIAIVDKGIGVTECKALNFMLCHMGETEKPTELVLRYNQFGNEGLHLLTEGICHHVTTLTQIDLYSCGLGPRSQELLAYCFSKTHNSLESLDLSCNPSLCENGVKSLVRKLLPRCRALKLLWLKKTGTKGKDAVDVVKSAEKHCDNMELLWIPSNLISYEYHTMLKNVQSFRVIYK